MISAVIAYSKSILEKRGYQEWIVGFSEQGPIPKSRLERSYELEFDKFRQRRIHQGLVEFEVPFRVMLYQQNSKDALASRNQAMERVDAVILDFMKVVKRTRFDGILDIHFFDGEVKAFGKTNDNAAIIELNFIAVVVGNTE